MDKVVHTIYRGYFIVTTMNMETAETVSHAHKNFYCVFSAKSGKRKSSFEKITEKIDKALRKTI